MEKLKLEDRVAIAINMSTVCVQICAASIIDQNPTISDQELINRVRERSVYRRKKKLDHFL